MEITRKVFSGCLLSLCLVGCGGGGNGASGANGSAPVTPANALLTFDTKLFQFKWTDVAGATFYRLLEDPDGVSGYTQVEADIPRGTQTVDHIVPLYRRVNARYILQSCNSAGCTDSGPILISGKLIDATGYFKASNTETQDFLSGDAGGDNNALALSGDGRTLAVGAVQEDSGGAGVNANQADNSTTGAGAVYVFALNGSQWSQQAYLKAGSTDVLDKFGNALSLNADGSILAVGSPFEDGNGTGAGGNEADNSVTDSGAVYIFTRTAGVWQQQSYLKASNTGGGDRFGWSVSLSRDGDTLAVGSFGEKSGIVGDQLDNSLTSAGAVYVFANSATSGWTQQAYLKASNPDAFDIFGSSLSLSGDANTLAVGAKSEASAATGVNGNQADNTSFQAGAVYVFTRAANNWSQQAYLKASNTKNTPTVLGASFGGALSLSDDGDTLAVGARAEIGGATGINGDQADNSAQFSGAVYVFTRAAGNWSQQAYIKASNAEANDTFGDSVSLSADGNFLAVGASFEASSDNGINADPFDNAGATTGAVYLFSRQNTTWSQSTYLKAPDSQVDDFYGSVIRLSADGNTLAVGARGDDGSATGINGFDDNGAIDAGAVYLY